MNTVVVVSIRAKYIYECGCRYSGVSLSINATSFMSFKDVIEFIFYVCDGLAISTEVCV